MEFVKNYKAPEAPAFIGAGSAFKSKDGFN
jgi:hypothetical protein